jgi:DNA polymerase III subunit delta
MKIAFKDTERSLEQPHIYSAMLLYGPDEGLARDRAKKLLNTLIRDTKDSFALITLEDNQVKENPAILIDSLSSLSLMGDAPVVYFRDATDKNASIIAEALKHPACQNYLVVCAGDLGTKSTLRRLFDTHKKTASIACYHDDMKSLYPYVSDFLKLHGISADNQALQLLCSQFGKDRAITNSELEKLVTYMGKDKHLNVKIIDEVSQNNDEKTIDNLCIVIGDGQLSIANQLCERLYLEGNEPIAIIRGINRYIQRLLTVHAYMQEGMPQDTAMQRLQPPVFWKMVSSFKSHLHAHTHEQLLTLSIRIQEAERELKHGKEPLAVILRCVSALAQMLQRKK